MNYDFEDAAVGAISPKAIASAARKLSRTALRDPSAVRAAASAMGTLAERLQRQASANVDNASKAGFLPSRYLGVDSNDQAAAGIGAGGQLGVQSTPTVEVRVIGFRTDDTFAADFNINGIRIATVDLIVGDQPCPASMFTTGIALPPLSAPKLPAGSPAITTVTNIAGAARRFRAGYPLAKLTNPEC